VTGSESRGTGVFYAWRANKISRPEMCMVLLCFSVLALRLLVFTTMTSLN
jgi:hypothetical protein